MHLAAFGLIICCFFSMDAYSSLRGTTMKRLLARNGTDLFAECVRNVECLAEGVAMNTENRDVNIKVKNSYMYSWVLFSSLSY